MPHPVEMHKGNRYAPEKPAAQKMFPKTGETDEFAIVPRRNGVYNKYDTQTRPKASRSKAAGKREQLILGGFDDVQGIYH